MSDTSLFGFADKVIELMPILFKEFASRQKDELFKGKITLPQFLVLTLLDKQGESKMSDLANFLLVTTAAMTGLVDRLVGLGYIKRTNDPQDRRIIKVRLTPRGEGLVKKIYEERRKMIIKIFGKIPETDRTAYLRILLQIKDILTRENSRQE